MNNRVIDEKIKPFRLVKYFSFTSLIFIFIGTIVLSSLNTHLARTMLLKKSEEYALVLVENLNHQIFLQFIIPVALKYGKIQLRQKDQFERLDKIVRSTLHSFKVEMVNIYDVNNIVSYSFDENKIGEKYVGSRGYSRASSGKTTSDLVQRGNFIEILFGFPKESHIITFAPIRAEKPLSRISGPVLGIIEIVQDLSDDYETIFRFQTMVIITSAVVMISLFLVLILVVKRGEGIIQKRAQERFKLKEQLSRAERLSSLGSMVAGISHELRNPLGIIRSSAELMKKKMANFDPTNKIPDIIVEESTRLNGLISDFLDFAKPLNPNLNSCSVNSIFDKLIQHLDTSPDAQLFEIHWEKPDESTSILADETMLFQAFLNIILNSKQAMPNGGPIFILTNKSNNGIFIFIEDEGEGVSEETLTKIWHPFFTTKNKGTGLGLSIVKNIIESHAGTIHIENRPGCGVRVSVFLPFNPHNQE